MARKSVTDVSSENTSIIYNDLMHSIDGSTTDLFIRNNYEMPVGLTTGEKVAVGFGIAGGAIVLGYILYKGIAYIVTKMVDKKTGEEKVDFKPVGNKQEVPVNIPEATTQQQPIVVPINGNSSEDLKQMIPLLQQTTQAVVNTANIVASHDQKFTEIDQSMANIKQNQDKLVEAITHVANTNSTLQNQFNTAMKNNELSDAMLNYMIGMYNNLARQAGAREITGAELVNLATGGAQPQPNSQQVMSPVYNMNQQPIIYGPNGQPMPAPNPVQ